MESGILAACGMEGKLDTVPAKPTIRLMMNPLLSLLLAATITGWRTDNTGRYPNATPVTTWSTTQNVVWATALPNWSNASPVLTGDRLFVCAEPTTLVCVNAADGKVLWERTNTYADAFPAEAKKINEIQQQTEPLQTELREVEKTLRDIKQKREAGSQDQALTPQETAATARAEAIKKQLAALDQWRMPKAHAVNGYSSCTPVTDGKFVWALFGNGIAACYDLDGNRRWIKLVEKPTANWGQSSSPTLAAGKLIVLVNSLYALDAATGNAAWCTPSKHRWGSPIATRVGNTEVIVTPNGEIVRATDGKPLVTGLTALDYNSPLVQDGVAYFIQHGGTAVKLSPAGDGVKAETLWTTLPKKDRYYGTPLLHDGLLYAITQKAQFSVIDAKTGEVVHERKLALTGTVYPSITLGGQYLFLGSEGGTTVVLEPGREPKEVSQIQFSRYRTCPVFQGDRLFIRALDKLYCIGK